MTKPRAGTKKCSTCLKNRQLKFFSSARARICNTCKRKSRSKASHAVRVQKTYDLAPGEYDRLLAAQGGCCAGCRQSRSYRLDVDHCHKTGLIRGLLCRGCNRKILPYSKDNPKILRSLADYLENPPALRILGERYHIDNREE